MRISNAQINTLAQAHSNQGVFHPDMSELSTGLLNRVIIALQTKGLLSHETQQGYPLTEAGELFIQGPNNRE